jgi:hypothetical protein
MIQRLISMVVSPHVQPLPIERQLSLIRGQILLAAHPHFFSAYQAAQANFGRGVAGCPRRGGSGKAEGFGAGGGFPLMRFNF